jgi:hypothetical protein
MLRPNLPLYLEVLRRAKWLSMVLGQPHISWTQIEEAAFASILASSRLTRVQAIQLWKRYRTNTEKAIQIAKDNYPPLTDRQLASIERLRQARDGVTLRAHLPSGAPGQPVSHAPLGGFAQR